MALWRSCLGSSPGAGGKAFLLLASAYAADASTRPRPLQQQDISELSLNATEFFLNLADDAMI